LDQSGQPSILAGDGLSAYDPSLPSAAKIAVTHNTVLW
jgi:hypothetical protein